MRKTHVATVFVMTVQPHRRAGFQATRHDVKFTAALTGISAAVVGVVLNLVVTSHVTYLQYNSVLHTLCDFVVISIFSDIQNIC